MWLRLVALMAVCAAGHQPALAVDWTVVPDPPEYTYEIWGGGEVTSQSWSTYAGSTTSLGSDVRGSGWKLRGAAGYGAYDYKSPRWDGRKRQPVAFSGTQAFGDVFLGYQHAFGPWIVKGFAGLSQDNHVITPHDIENPVQGSRYGFKGALETWLTLGEYAFVQTDTSWSQVFNAYSARLRGGYRLHPAWSTGLELGATGNAAHDSGRLGAFLRLEWNFGEISVSTGGAGDRSGLTGPYSSIALMIRF